MDLPLRLYLQANALLDTIAELENNPELYQKKLKTKTIVFTEEIEKLVNGTAELLRESEEGKKTEHILTRNYVNLINSVSIGDLLQKEPAFVTLEYSKRKAIEGMRYMNKHIIDTNPLNGQDAKNLAYKWTELNVKK